MSTLKSSAEDLTLNADGSGNDVIIQSNASTKVTVDGSAGDVKVESGDLFFATAGKGIVLGATSNTDANTLEDYEEGTWTPEYDNNSDDLTRVMYGNTGTYTKIGNVVFIQGQLATESLTASAVWIKIDNLPFAIAADNYGGIQITTAENFGDDYPISGLTSSSSSGFLLVYRNAADGATASLLSGDMSTTASTNQNRARFFGNYRAA